MVSCKVEGLNRVILKIDKLDEEVMGVIMRVFRRQSQSMANYIIIRHLTGGTTSDRLARRTGTLAKSTRPRKVERKGKKVVGGVVLGTEYAKVHVGEKGKVTTIRPRRAQFLAIPLSAAKTAAGVPRGRPRDFGNTFIQRSRRGNLLIFQKRLGSIVPLFALKKEVRIPARVHLEEVASAFAGRIAKDIEQSIRAAARG